MQRHDIQDDGTQYYTKSFVILSMKALEFCYLIVLYAGCRLCSVLQISPFKLSVIILNVVMLNVLMLNVLMLNVLMLNVVR